MSKKAPERKGSRAKLREYFIKNVGKILNSDILREIAGTSEWGRRVRELRNEEGMNIVTHNDRSELKPGQYFLYSTGWDPDISQEVKGGIGIKIKAKDKTKEIDLDIPVTE